MDSLLINDFYKEDFFEKRYLMNTERMRELFKEMDSMKNEYYMHRDL